MTAPRHKKRMHFAQDRRGSVAIEFAFVVPILLLVVFWTIELAVMFYLRANVESAVQTVARAAITGSNMDEKGTRAQVFERLMRREIERVLLRNMTYTIQSRVWDTVSQVGVGGNQPSFSAGGKAQIVHYKVIVAYNFITPLVGKFLPDEGTYSLISSAFVKNEAY